MERGQSCFVKSYCSESLWNACWFSVLFVPCFRKKKELCFRVVVTFISFGPWGHSSHAYSATECLNEASEEDNENSK